MDVQKVLQCQKYYVFKIRNIVNNSFHTLEEKRIDCLIQYLELCISTYDEYRMALDPGKIKKSYEGLIEGIDFQLQNHPFRNLLEGNRDKEKESAGRRTNFKPSGRYKMVRPSYLFIE